MPDKTHTYSGYVTLDPFSGTITFTNGVGGGPANEGDAGSVLNWTGLFTGGDLFGDEDDDALITDLNDDGILVAGTPGSGLAEPGVDFMHVPSEGDNYGFSGYTITAGGVDYPIYQSTIYFFVPLPVNGTTQTIIPNSGSSNVYQGSASNVFLCFGEGTGIATPQGEVAVERLKIGDAICAAESRTTQVKWIGRQTLSKWSHGAHMQPVRIRAGALGGGLPNSDLVVTADHGMIIDGLVINASALVNGSSIDFVPMAELEQSFSVYHIETEHHEVILANGAPSESFIDMAGRKAFDNFQDYLDLYGTERVLPEMPLPRIAAARLVPQAIQDQLSLARTPARPDLARPDLARSA